MHIDLLLVNGVANDLFMNEEWRDIKGYEGSYQVSNTRKVRSLDRTIMAGKPLVPTMIKGKEIKSRISKNGYEMVTVSSKSNTKHMHVHRLVAEAFIPNNDKKREINHIDANKLNNNVENLEWVTSQENKIHANKNGLYKNRYIGAEKIAKKQRIPIVMDNNILVFGVNKTAKELGFSASSITQVLHGERDSTHGHTFRYATEQDISQFDKRREEADRIGNFFS